MNIRKLTQRTVTDQPHARSLSQFEINDRFVAFLQRKSPACCMLRPALQQTAHGCTAAPDEPHYLKPSRLLVPIYRAPMWRTENLVTSIFGTPLNGAKLLCRISSGKFFSEAALVSR